MRPYGSFVSGLYTPQGDLDLALDGSLDYKCVRIWTESHPANCPRFAPGTRQLNTTPLGCHQCEIVSVRGERALLLSQEWEAAGAHLPVVHPAAGRHAAGADSVVLTRSLPV